MTILSAGCSVNWYNDRTGTQHLLGFGHFKMRAVPQAQSGDLLTNAVMAYVTGVRNVGLQLGAGSDFAGLSAGWDARSRVIIKSDNSSFYLLWPTNALWMPDGLKDLFNLQIGTNSLLNPDHLPQE